MLKRVGCLGTLTAACLLSGCGTLANLGAPVAGPDDLRACGPAGCEPFGGVQRSLCSGAAVFSAAPVTPIGVAAGVVIVGVDVPLSLVGDVVTLPLVFYRQCNASDTKSGAPLPPVDKD